MLTFAVKGNVVGNLTRRPEEQKFTELQFKKSAGMRTEHIQHLPGNGNTFRSHCHCAVIGFGILHGSCGQTDIATAGGSLPGIAEGKNGICGGAGTGQSAIDPGVVPDKGQLNEEQGKEKNEDFFAQQFSVLMICKNQNKS